MSVNRVRPRWQRRTSRGSPTPAIRLKAGLLIHLLPLSQVLFPAVPLVQVRAVIHPLPLSQVLVLAIPLAQVRAAILADHPVANSIEGMAFDKQRSDVGAGRGGHCRAKRWAGGSRPGGGGEEAAPGGG